MNFDANKILAELQNGVDANDLAIAFTNALNAAIKEKNAADAAAAKARAKKEKVKELGDIMDQFVDYFKKWYGDKIPADMIGTGLSDQEKEDLVDTIEKGINDAIRLRELFSDVAAPTTAAADEDPIKAFLKKQGLA